MEHHMQTAEALGDVVNAEPCLLIKGRKKS